MHTKLVARHGEISSISGSAECSTSDLVHGSSISLVDRQEDLRELSKPCSGCGEVDNFLNAIRINSSWKEDTPATARIWESASRDILKDLGHSWISLASWWSLSYSTQKMFCHSKLELKTANCKKTSTGNESTFTIPKSTFTSTHKIKGNKNSETRSN